MQTTVGLREDIILVVDDDPTLRMLVRATLEEVRLPGRGSRGREEPCDNLSSISRP